MEIIKPCDLMVGEELLHKFLIFHESQFFFEKIIYKTFNIEPETLREKKRFVKGFFLGDGSSGIFKYKSGIKYYWHLKNLDFNLIQKIQRFCKGIWGVINFKIYDFRETSKIYRISSSKKKQVLEFDKFYTKNKGKVFLVIY